MISCCSSRGLPWWQHLLLCTTGSKSCCFGKLLQHLLKNKRNLEKNQQTQHISNLMIPLDNQSKVKRKPIVACAHYSRALMPVTYIFFTFWVHGTVPRYLWLVGVITQLKTALLTNKTLQEIIFALQQPFSDDCGAHRRWNISALESCGAGLSVWIRICSGWWVV